MGFINTAHAMLRAVSIMRVSHHARSRYLRDLRCVIPTDAAVTRQEIELMDSYSTANARLLEEIEATDAGDCIDIGLYLLEPGKSSEMVLDALLEAGSNRGVQVTFHLDVSYVSMISRIIEKTTTLIPRAASMAARHPEWCRTRYRSKPDHSKYACFARSTQPDTAILGGMNLGDRFSDWNDFAVRVSSPHAKELRQLLLGDVASTPSPDQYEGTALTSANTAKAIAIGSPLLSLAHTLSGLALICAPVACLVAPESAPAIVAALGLGLVTTNILGAAIGTSADGAAYSLIDELSGFALSLIYDRSWLGDRLAFLRGVYPIDVPSRADWETACDTPCERRYLPLPEIFPDSVGGASNVRVVSNYRLQMRYEIEPTFRALFSEPRLTRYRVAVAYLGHRWGVELLSQALKRGASVELLMPQQANVYAEENLKAASALLEVLKLNSTNSMPPVSPHILIETTWSFASCYRPRGKDTCVSSSCLRCYTRKPQWRVTI